MEGSKDKQQQRENYKSLRISQSINRKQIKKLSSVLRKSSLYLLASFLAVHLTKVLLSVRKKSDLNSLLDQVEASQRINAALRALENGRQDQLLKDPLAEKIAGTEVLYRTRTNMEELNNLNNEYKDKQNGTNGKGSFIQIPFIKDLFSPANYKSAIYNSLEGSASDDIKDLDILETMSLNQVDRTIDRYIAKEIFVDDLIRCCSGYPRFHPFFKSLRIQILESNYFPIKQIVILNAAMDTRPWRLELPTNLPWGIRFFELDKPNNIQIKKKLFQKLNCQLKKNQKAGSYEYELKCNAYQTVECNLLESGWSKNLINNGFDIKKPALFVAQSFLQFLDDESVQTFMKEVAQIAKPSSVFFGSSVTWEALQQALNSYQHYRSFIQNFNWGFPSNVEEYFGQLGWGTHSCIEQSSGSMMYSRGLNTFKGVDPLKVKYLIATKQ